MVLQDLAMQPTTVRDRSKEKGVHGRKRVYLPDSNLFSSVPLRVPGPFNIERCSFPGRDLTFWERYLESPQSDEPYIFCPHRTSPEMISRSRA